MKTILMLLMVMLTGPAWGQSSPPTKIYKWNHPWFKKEITSPTPPSWEYRVIEEKNGVVFVEVTPPGAAIPKTTTPSPEFSSIDQTPTKFRYIDPVTGRSVTSTSPPTEYQWEKKRIEEDGTVWFLKIIRKTSEERPSPAYTRRPTPSVANDPTPIDLPEEKSQALGDVCFGVIKKVVKFYDPYSARMDSQRLLRMPNQNLAIVVEINAKNRFGAYIGAQPFYCVIDNRTMKLVDAGKGEP